MLEVGMCSPSLNCTLRLSDRSYNLLLQSEAVEKSNGPQLVLHCPNPTICARPWACVYSCTSRRTYCVHDLNKHMFNELTTMGHATKGCWRMFVWMYRMRPFAPNQLKRLSSSLSTLLCKRIKVWTPLLTGKQMSTFGPRLQYHATAPSCHVSCTKVALFVVITKYAKFRLIHYMEVRG